MRLSFISHVFNFLSVGVFGGDAVRAVAMARRVPGRVPETVASVLVDRLIGLWSMLVFASAAYWLTDLRAIQALHPETLRAVRVLCWFTTIVSVVSCAAAMIVFLIPEPALERLDRAFARVPQLGGLLSRLHNVARVYRRNKTQLLAASLNSMSINVLFAISIFFVAHAISDDHPTMGQHLVISPIVMVANAAPLPGGLGGMEFALDLLYKAFSQASIPSEHGFVVALGYRLIWLTVAAIGACCYFVKKSGLPASDDLQRL
jgi:uncharacterized protein (TIRG00374 family)